MNASSGWILADAGERQYFLIGPDTAPIPQWPAGVHAAAQSDGWVALVVEGKATREVLSRLCGLDLHRAVFPRGSAARSPFEGMLAVILCLEDDVRPAYRILFQRSSARSFVDHLRHAAARVCGPAVPGSGAAH